MATLLWSYSTQTMQLPRVGTKTWTTFWEMAMARHHSLETWTTSTFCTCIATYMHLCIFFCLFIFLLLAFLWGLEYKIPDNLSIDFHSWINAKLWLLRFFFFFFLGFVLFCWIVALWLDQIALSQFHLWILSGEDETIS